MTFIPRMIAPHLLRASRHFNAVILTGPRPSGKTTLNAVKKGFQKSHPIKKKGGGGSSIRDSFRCLITQKESPMNIFDLRHLTVEEYGKYVQKLFSIADVRVREFIKEGILTTG